MLGAFERQSVSPLLGQRFLGHVFGKLQPLGLHADILQHSRISAELLGKNFLHATDPLSDNRAEPPAGGHLVNQLQGIEAVAEREVHAAGVVRIDQSPFKTFHDEGDAGSHADGIQAVGIAVKVDLQNGEGIENPQVGTAAGNGFIFGPIHEYPLPFIRAGERHEILDPVGAGHGAAFPAAIKSRIEELCKNLPADERRPWVGSVLEVVGGQQVKIVHDGHQVGGANAGHLILLGV